MAKSILRRIVLGIVSGIIGGICCLILAYIAGVIVVANSLRDLLGTLLAALTVLPLMLIIVGVPITVALSVLTGAILGIMAAVRNGPFGFLASALVGMACSELILSLLVPLVAPPQRGDFIHIISNPLLSGGYGLVLGVVASRFFRWMDPEKQ